MRTNRRLSWLLAALPALAPACVIDDDPQDSDGSAFEASDNDDQLGDSAGGKADAIAGYRSGCGSAIRSGRYALRGDVVTPTGVVADGYLVVDGELIAEVRAAGDGPGDGVSAVVDTDGILFPGLIDGHNHVEYNVLPLLDLTKRYGNRDQWPKSAAYDRAIKNPRKAVTAAKLTCEAIKHGEVRALVGGTTSIQGTPYSPCVRPLVRNAEQTNFCRDRVKTNVMAAVSFGKGKPSFAETIKKDLMKDRLDAFVVHLGEGIDKHAFDEWDIVKKLGLVLPELVMIHGTAFTAPEFDELATSGGKLVWSPLSNYYLYGQTTDIPRAIEAGVLVSLGADWSPSGSANVLAELKVADRVNKLAWNSAISDEDLVAMVTTNPAIAFGLDAELGSLTPGRHADVMVIRRPAGAASAYRALIDAAPADVLLVTIAGDPLFGAEPFLRALGKDGDYELIDACGAPRAIDVTVNATPKDVPGGSDSLQSVETKLRGVLPQLTPVFDCTNDATRRAFAGTPLAL